MALNLNLTTLGFVAPAGLNRNTPAPTPLRIENGVLWAVPPGFTAYPVAFASATAFGVCMTRFLAGALGWGPLDQQYLPLQVWGGILGTVSAGGSFGSPTPPWMKAMFACAPSQLPLSSLSVAGAFYAFMGTVLGQTGPMPPAPPTMGPAYPGLGGTITAPNASGATSTMNVAFVMLTPNVSVPRALVFYRQGSMFQPGPYYPN